MPVYTGMGGAAC